SMLPVITRAFMKRIPSWLEKYGITDHQVEIPSLVLASDCGYWVSEASPPDQLA
ncbi:hypothetical protein BGZ81_009260, partial [Podila clonocystis]